MYVSNELYVNTALTGLVTTMTFVDFDVVWSSSLSTTFQLAAAPGGMT